MLRDAAFSPCRFYRYSLTREWLIGHGKLVMIMLNPSYADRWIDDATTTLMVRRARRDGFGRYEAVNLFALISTDPKLLLNHPDPVGPDNDAAIAKAVSDADRIIVAWGNHGALAGRAAAVMRLLEGRELYCFDRTKTGAPRFPRALRSDTPLEPFNPLI